MLTASTSPGTSTNIGHSVLYFLRDRGRARALCPLGLAPCSYVSMEFMLRRGLCRMGNHCVLKWTTAASSHRSFFFFFNSSCASWRLSASVDVFWKHRSLQAWNNSQRVLCCGVHIPLRSPRTGQRLSDCTAAIMTTTASPTFPVIEMQHQSRGAAEAKGEAFLSFYFMQIKINCWCISSTKQHVLFHEKRIKWYSNKKATKVGTERSTLSGDLLTFWKKFETSLEKPRCTVPVCPNKSANGQFQ